MKKNNNFFTDLTTAVAAEITSKTVVDPVTFAEASWGLNFKFLPVQKFIIKVFYGMVLNNSNKYIPVPDIWNEKILYHFTEVEFMNWLIDEGRCNIREYIPGKQNDKFRQLVLCCGRRGSKSSLAAVIANYEVYKLIKKDNPQEYYGFPDGENIGIVTIATDGDQAGNLFDMIKSRSRNCSYLSDRMVHDTKVSFDLQTDNDIKCYGKNKKSTIKLTAQGCSSTGLRGKNNIAAILDEAAFFIDNSGKYSGDAVYKAVSPSIASFTQAGTSTDGDGKIVVLSSPFIKSGLFWNIYNEAWDSPNSHLLFKLYSALINPTIDSSFLKLEYKKSRSSFKCEYEAEFSDNVSSWVEEEERFNSVIDKKKTSNPTKGEAHHQYFMGIDLGLKNDGTGISIVHKEDNTIITDYSEVWFSGSSDIWNFPNSIYKKCNKEFIGYEIIPLSEIAKKIEYLCKWFPIKAGTYDQWAAGYALAEFLTPMGITQINMNTYSPGLTMQMWSIIQSMYEEKLLTLFDHPILIPELLSLECNRGAKNVQVHAPQREGFHDDISDSWARAVFECYRTTSTTDKNYSISFSKRGDTFKKNQFYGNNVNKYNYTNRNINNRVNLWNQR